MAKPDSFMMEYTPMRFEVINLRTKKSHGCFETLGEAKGCVTFDRLTDWEIWTKQTDTVVAYRDSGRF